MEFGASGETRRPHGRQGGSARRLAAAGPECETAAQFAFRTAAVIVAHPDDETLWAGGLILTHRECDWTVVGLCRKSDPDRAPKFRRALASLGASGMLGDLDDGPEQRPLAEGVVREAVAALIPASNVFDAVLTHSPRGEYTKHRRHEETGKAVASLWMAGLLAAKALWLFAYEDGQGQYPARAIPSAHWRQVLSAEVWQAKGAIITDVYGFSPSSFEASTTPREEAFWCFDSGAAYSGWLIQNG
jgi:hypothetical protein